MCRLNKLSGEIMSIGTTPIITTLFAYDAKYLGYQNRDHQNNQD